MNRIRNKWGLERNPFPAEAIAVLGGSDDRENGRLFRPEVQTEQFDQAIGKFVLGAIYNGQRFGVLWYSRRFSTLTRAGTASPSRIRAEGLASLVAELRQFDERRAA